jgi:phosphoglycolate phosphatase-like HAD superfamily hydrolase
MNARPSLILWDIDGTLIGSDGITDALLRDALATSFGATDALATTSFAGKTDAQIIQEIYGPDPPVVSSACPSGGCALEQFITTYHRLVYGARRQLLLGATVLPGAIPMLEMLARYGHTQSIVTGNVRRVAHYKLRIFGLLPAFATQLGAYGDESTRREDLVALALQRAQAQLPQLQPDRTLIIGDTPHDIAAGRTRGVRTLGVATGAFSEAGLRAAGADLVVPNLQHASSQLQALLAHRMEE